MDDILSTLISFAVIIIITVVQSVGKKKNKKSTHEHEVLNSPLPQVEPEVIVQESKSQEKPKKTLSDIIIKEIFGNSMQNHQEEAVAEKLTTIKPKPLSKEPLQKATIVEQHIEPIEDNTSINIDFTNQEEVKHAFIASIIFNKKY